MHNVLFAIIFFFESVSVCSDQEFHEPSIDVDFLPRGIVHSSSDMELKPLWMTRDAKSKVSIRTACHVRLQT